MNRRFVLLGMSAIASVFGLNCVSASSLSEVEERQVIRVAVVQDFPPYASVGPDLNPLGYDIDFARIIAERLGVKVEFVPVTSVNRIPYIQSSKADIVMSIGKNPDRAKVIDFSDGYVPFSSGVFGLADVPVTKADDLDGKNVGVVQGAVEDLIIADLAPPTATIRRFDSSDGLISAFLSGQLDLIVTGQSVVATVNEKGSPRVLVTKFMIRNAASRIGMEKGQDDLMQKINQIIASAIADGTLNGLCEKWLKTPLPADLATYP
jgi:polar amino acid transport system substrate-binding protein